MLGKKVSLAGVKRLLYAKGLRNLPTCPRCGHETDPRQWGTEACRDCEAAVAFRDNRIQQIDRELALLWGAGREGAAVQDATDALEIERADLLAPTGDRSPHTSGGGQCLGCRQYKEEWEEGGVDACLRCGHLHPTTDACPVFPPADWGKP